MREDPKPQNFLESVDMLVQKGRITEKQGNELKQHGMEKIFNKTISEAQESHFAQK